MSLLDLSAYQKDYVKDTAEDMKAIADMKQISRIPEGTHEVIITGFYEKDGQKLKIIDKLGGCLSFGLIVKNALRQEQMLFFSIPLIMTFFQASTHETEKWLFRKNTKNLMAIGIDPSLLRESVIVTNGASIDALVGAQFTIVNYWNPKMVHLEYDATAKANFFVTAMGERFASGEMALPITLDLKIPTADRFKECTAIAHENHYQFKEGMETTIEAHPTVNNDHINEALRKYLQPKEPKRMVVNKTIPATFPSVKKPTVSLDIEPDIEL